MEPCTSTGKAWNGTPWRSSATSPIIAWRRLVPQLAAQRARTLERLVAGRGDDRRHPLRHVHLAEPLVGERVRPLVGRPRLVLAVLVDQRRLVVRIGEAFVAPHGAVGRRRPVRRAQRAGGGSARGPSPSSPPAASSSARDRRRPVAPAGRRRRGRLAPRRPPLLVAQRRLDEPHRRVVGERVGRRRGTSPAHAAAPRESRGRPPPATRRCRARARARRTPSRARGRARRARRPTDDAARSPAARRRPRAPRRARHAARART